MNSIIVSYFYSQFGKELLSHDEEWGFNFESALIISMKNSEVKNEILVSMVVQFFDMSTIQTETFGEKWENMIQAEEKLKVLVKSEKNTTKDLEYCPKLSTLKPEMPPELWTASNLGENDVFKVCKQGILLRGIVNWSGSVVFLLLFVVSKVRVF